MATRREKLEKATKHLRQRDPVMRKVIRRVGPCVLPLRRNRFAILVRSILSQQISTAAARTIRERLENALAPEPVSPESLLSLTVEQLRGVGISRQKASYLLDLADRTRSGELRFQQFAKMTDEQIIAQLTCVKGVGRWTAEMLLIFALGRLDVLPCDDLGVRSAIRHLYDLGELPNRAECQQIGLAWRPYASVASWYCWRSLELRAD